jgi:hypothetical protein
LYRRERAKANSTCRSERSSAALWANLLPRCRRIAAICTVTATGRVRITRVPITKTQATATAVLRAAARDAAVRLAAAGAAVAVGVAAAAAPARAAVCSSAASSSESILSDGTLRPFAAAGTGTGNGRGTPLLTTTELGNPALTATMVAGRLPFPMVTQV